MNPKVFVKRKVGDGELRLYHHLSRLAQRYNDSFRTLVLPSALHVDHRRRTVTMPFYVGERFEKRWDEESGGARLGLDLATDMAGIVRDLTIIDTAPLLEDPTLMAAPKVAYDDAEAVGHAMAVAGMLVHAGHLSRPELGGIASALGAAFQSPLIMNNGDFYPRNLIRRRDGRVVLVDWETWNPNSPFYVLDHPENVAAVAFVHMWGNEPWRGAFAQGLEAHLRFEAPRFRKSVVLKALELAHMWLANLEGPALVDCQVSLVREVLAEG